MASYPGLQKKSHCQVIKGKEREKEPFSTLKAEKQSTVPALPAPSLSFLGEIKVGLELNKATQVPPWTQSMPQIIRLLPGTLSEVSVFSYLGVDKRIKGNFHYLFQLLGLGRKVDSIPAK